MSGLYFGFQGFKYALTRCLGVILHIKNILYGYVVTLNVFPVVLLYEAYTVEINILRKELQ
jgi:hypothetical protein